jgi:arylsulfatase A-like enzyme
MKRTARIFILGAGMMMALSGCERVGPHEGYGVLDVSVYADARKDAQPVAEVVRRSAETPARLPNIVIILADDLGYGDLGAYGNTLLRTPNLDALSRSGARLTEFYASAPTCSPSRAGLLTGRYPLRSGIEVPIHPTAHVSMLNRLLSRIGTYIGSVDGTASNQVNGLPASEITLGEALQVAGYATGMVGKWHLGDFRADPRYHPQRHGFDFFAGFPHSNGEFPYSYWKNETMVDDDLGLRQQGVTALLTREAIGFIDTNQHRPFFLYFAHKNVHIPLLPAPEFAGKSAGGVYGDSVEELDASVGEIVNALATRGLIDNTLIFFTSDNGPWYVGSSGGLRGRKGQPLEGGQRVPAIAQWPGHIPAASVIATPTMNIDLFPTLLRLAGLELPEDRIIDGQDIAPLLRGEASSMARDELFFFGAGVIDGVRSGRWKYYRYVNLYVWPFPLDKVTSVTGRGVHAAQHVDAKTGETHAALGHDPLLFDVVSDPGESYDLTEHHPQEAARLRANAERWEREFFANPRGWK